jgi:hypothetical protein
MDEHYESYLLTEEGNAKRIEAIKEFSNNMSLWAVLGLLGGYTSFYFFEDIIFSRFINSFTLKRRYSLCVGFAVGSFGLYHGYKLSKRRYNMNLRLIRDNPDYILKKIY